MFKRLVVMGLAGAFLSACAGMPSPQQEAATEPVPLAAPQAVPVALPQQKAVHLATKPAPIIEPGKDWMMYCSSDSKIRSNCGMALGVTGPDGTWVKVAVGYSEDKLVMLFAVPPSAQLMRNIVVGFENGKNIRLPIKSCDQDRCTGRLILSPAHREFLENNRQISIEFAKSAQAGVQYAISTERLRAALVKLDKLKNS